MRGTLRNQLLRLSVIAKEFSDEFPSERFRMPRSSAANEVLLSAAKQTLQNARQRKDRFIALGRPADFVEKLEQAIRTFERAGDAQVNGVAIRINAVGDALNAARDGLKLSKRMGAMAASLHPSTAKA